MSASVPAQRLSDPTQAPPTYVDEGVDADGMDIRPYEEAIKETRIVWLKRGLVAGFAILLLLTAVVVTYAVTNSHEVTSTSPKAENGGGGMPSFLTSASEPLRGANCPANKPYVVDGSCCDQAHIGWGGDKWVCCSNPAEDRQCPKTWSRYEDYLYYAPVQAPCTEEAASPKKTTTTPTYSTAIDRHSFIARGDSYGEDPLQAAVQTPCGEEAVPTKKTTNTPNKKTTTSPDPQTAIDRHSFIARGDFDIRGDSSCDDTVGHCPIYKKRGYCEKTSRYYDYMLKNCITTCGSCPNGPISEGTTSYPLVSELTSTTTTEENDCAEGEIWDDSKNCCQLSWMGYENYKWVCCAAETKLEDNGACPKDIRGESSASEPLRGANCPANKPYVVDGSCCDEAHIGWGGNKWVCCSNPANNRRCPTTSSRSASEPLRGANCPDNKPYIAPDGSCTALAPPPPTGWMLLFAEPRT